MRIQHATLAGNGDSDDRIFTTPNAVVMLDGASAFLPVPVPSARYADVLGQHIRDALIADPAADLPQTLSRAIEQTRTDLQLTPGTSPTSTVAIARATADGLDMLVLGDTEIITPAETLRDYRMDDLDLAARRRYRQRLADGGGYDEEHRALLRRLQAEHARRRNRPGGYWIAEADPEAAYQAITATRPLSAVPWVVLATDGAYETMRHLGLDDWDEVARCDSDQLAAILRRCQRWEAEHDPEGRELPRAKRHDDKSIAVMTFTTGAPAG